MQIYKIYRIIIYLEQYKFISITPLFAASRKGNIEIVRYLLKKLSWDINTTSYFILQFVSFFVRQFKNYCFYPILILKS